MAGGGKHTRGRGIGPRPISNEGNPAGTNINDPCDITFETVLNSVAPSALQNVSRGNRLELVADSKQSPPRLEAIHNGVFVGVISHPLTLNLIGCIEQGNEYGAIVVERQANLCKVKVERQTK